ncbi:MucBP domain-containing protein [Lactococcus sp.]|uniref:MucBP domain-containing protein n=1 Tax=Lactococcus sp. TaxID=44273 RepID=UPI002FCC4DF7
MKDKKILWLNLLTLFVAFITLFSFGNKSYAAEMSTATVTTEYIDYSSLNPTQQSKIIMGNPSSIIKHDKETFSLVYKKVENKNNVIPSSSSITPIKNLHSNSKNVALLPQTGEQSGRLLYVLGVLIIAITGFALYKWRRTKHIILILLILGSLGGFKNVSATTLENLASKNTTKYSIGSEYSENISSISGYEYIGYLHDYSDNAKPVENGIVTIQFVNESNSEVAPSKTLTGIVGSEYTTSSEEIDGYTLSSTPSNANGKFTLASQTVKYIYKEVDQSAIITVKFVDNSGNPFVIPDFTTLKNGAFVSQYPNLAQYSAFLDYNGQTYNQKQTVDNITIPTKMGEKYSLPEQVTFHIKDGKGNDVDYLISPNEDGSSSGTRYWYSLKAPDNVNGTVQDKEIIVTYVIEGYGVVIAAP